jgi:hypothetical protein
MPLTNTGRRKFVVRRDFRSIRHSESVLQSIIHLLCFAVVRPIIENVRRRSVKVGGETPAYGMMWKMNKENELTGIGLPVQPGATRNDCPGQIPPFNS